MKRITASALLIGSLLMAVQPVFAQGTVDAAAAQSGVSAQVLVNGQPVQFEGQPPIEQNGHLLVPLRGVLEKLGAYVDFDSAHQTVVAFRGQTRITLPIGSNQAQVNGQVVTLDVAAQVVNGSTLVPLRFVAESLGAQVNFDVNTNTVRIAMASLAPSPGRPMMPPPPPHHDNDAAWRARQAEDARRAAEARSREEARQKAADAERQRLAQQNAVVRTVVALYQDVNPPRIVLHVGGPGAPGEDRTIPLPGNVPVAFAHQGGGTSPMPLNHVAEGDLVSVLQNGDGNGTAIHVLAPPPGSPDFHTHPWVAGTFRGEFIAREDHDDKFRLRMVDGRVIEVPHNVPVMFKNHPVRPEDIRPGDVLSVQVDPKSHLGIRVIVNP